MKLRKQLMNKLTKKLKANRVKGIHLMKAGDNQASEFYKSCGFKRYPVNMDSNKGGTLSLKPTEEYTCS